MKLIQIGRNVRRRPRPARAAARFAFWRAIIVLVGGLLLGVLLGGCSQAEMAALRNPPVAARVLLVTQEDRVFGYEAKVMRGVARGQSQNFSQWHATVLNEDRRPLAIYGIPDPRLVLEHGPQSADWALDSETSFLFDVVIPVKFDEEDQTATETLPRLLQVRDQTLTLLLEIDLTDAFTEYCTTSEGAGTVPCEALAFPLPELPTLPPGLDIPNPSTPAEERPQATVDYDGIGDRENVHACLPLDDEVTPSDLMRRLEGCAVVTAAQACPALDFVPGAGEFDAGTALDGENWEVEGVALSVDGASTYRDEGILFQTGGSMQIVLRDDCVTTSVALRLRPSDEIAVEGAGPRPAPLGDAQAHLQNGGQDIWLNLPMTTTTELRVSGIPLAQVLAFVVDDSTALVERIRINVPEQAAGEGEPAPVAPPSATPTPTPTPTTIASVTPTATSTPTPGVTVPVPAGPFCTVLVPRLNLRPGPGTNFNPPVTALVQGTILVPLARNAAGTWIQVALEGDDVQGWASAGSQFITCNIDIGDLPLATDIPTIVTPTLVTPTLVTPTLITPSSITPTFITPVPITPATVTPEQEPVEPIPPDGELPSLACVADPSRVAPGGQAVVSWQSSAATVYLNEELVDSAGSLVVTPEQTQTFLFRAVGAGGEVTCAVTVEVVGTPAPPLEQPTVNIRFWVDDDQIEYGECTVLRWSVQNVQALYLDEEGVVGEGERSICPEVTQTYTLRVVTGSGEDVRTITVEVTTVESSAPNREPVTPAATVEFWSEHDVIYAGECTILYWEVQNVRAVYFEGEGVPGVGMSEVCPEQSQRYTLLVDTGFDEQRHIVTVEVIPAETSEQGSTPEASPVSVEFWTEYGEIYPGECTVLYWLVANAQAVYFEGQGVGGEGKAEVCPAETQSYDLDVISDAGEETWTLTITVQE